MSVSRNTFIAVLALAACLAGGAFAQEADPPPAPPAGEQPVVDIEFGIDVDRETRAIVGAATVFGPDLERIWCLTRVRGLAPPATVTHAWYYEGKTMARVDLKVGSPDWRTWSSKRYLPAWTGHWEVKVLDEMGRVLGAAGFDIE